MTPNDRARWRAARPALALALALGAGCGGSSIEVLTTIPATGVCAELLPPSGAVQLSVGPFADLPYVDPQHPLDFVRCSWRKVSRAVDVGRVQISFDEGSYDLAIFQVDYDMPQGAADFDCGNAAEWGQWSSQLGIGGLDAAQAPPRILASFQQGVVNYELTDAKIVLPRGKQLLIRSHFKNGNTERLDRSYNALKCINLYDADNPATARPVETLFDQETMLDIPAGTTLDDTRYCVLPVPLDIVSLSGHFNSLGTEFTIFEYNPDLDLVGALLFDGGFRGSTAPVEGIKISAEYHNGTTSDFSWGFFVEGNEVMETSVTFSPPLWMDPKCVCYRQGEPRPNCPP